MQRPRGSCLLFAARLVAATLGATVAFLSVLLLVGIASLCLSGTSVHGRSFSIAQIGSRLVVFAFIPFYLFGLLPLMVLAIGSLTMRLHAAWGLEAEHRRHARQRVQFINGLRMVPPFVRRRWRYLLVVAVVFVLVAFQFDEDLAFIALGVMYAVNCILAFVVDMLLGVRSLRDEGGPVPPDALQHALECAESYISVLMDGATLPNGADDCSVCMEPLVNEVCALVSCGHIFHARCLRMQVAHALVAQGRRGSNSMHADALPLCALCRAPIAALGPPPRLEAAASNVPAVHAVPIATEA